MPEFTVEWSFSEIVEAEDEESALAMMRERVDNFVEPHRFQVKRSILWKVEAMPPNPDLHCSS